MQQGDAVAYVHAAIQGREDLREDMKQAAAEVIVRSESAQASFQQVVEAFMSKRVQGTPLPTQDDANRPAPAHAPAEEIDQTDGGPIAVPKGKALCRDVCTAIDVLARAVRMDAALVMLARAAATRARGLAPRKTVEADALDMAAGALEESAIAGGTERPQDTEDERKDRVLVDRVAHDPDEAVEAMRAAREWRALAQTCGVRLDQPAYVRHHLDRFRANREG